MPIYVAVCTYDRPLIKGGKTSLDIFDALTLIGGLCLFLFGMNVMGESLERRAGSSLQGLLTKLTTGRMAGFLTGLAVTSVIQSSSATTVMVVGFVNSGIMTLTQAINVIMGANVGTTVTAWLISLAGIDGEGLFIQLLKPMSFTPILALAGIVFTMFCKSSKKKDTGCILLGFAVLMFGMDIMSGAVEGLKDEAWFTQLFLAFENPILAMLAGAVLTGVIQSSSASVGILQALSSTGVVTIGMSIPIIMGQNIGTTVTALLSSVGTNKNARRAALVHLCFNVIGTIVWLTVFCIVKAAAAPAILNVAASEVSIAVCHSAFNIACTAMLLPMSSLLEKLSYAFIPKDKTPEKVEELDERLLATPAAALERANALSINMAECACHAVNAALNALDGVDADTAARIRQWEDKTDHYEDVLGSYLVKLSTTQTYGGESARSAMLLKAIGDFERIGDHAASVLHAAEEMKQKEISFTKAGQKELATLREAITEIVGLAEKAFRDNDLEAALRVEPLEQVVDRIRDQLRRRHIERLQQGNCSIEAGFIWSDLLTDLSRVSDHCSNIAGGVIDLTQQTMNIHEAMRTMKSESEKFKALYQDYKAKYLQNI